MASISCADCGEQRNGVPKNTRYCRACRLLRDIRFWATQTRQCRECRRAFAPLGRNDLHCSTCDPGLVHKQIECGLGKWDRAPIEPHSGAYLRGGVVVCATCLRAPDRRRWLIKALEAGQRFRQKENGHVPEA